MFFLFLELTLVRKKSIHDSKLIRGWAQFRAGSQFYLNVVVIVV